MKYLTFLISILLFFQFGCREQNIVGVDQNPNAPVVKIASPVDSASIFDTTTILISATCPKGIKKVVLSIDSVAVDTLWAEPYVYLWNVSSLVEGSGHKISAKGYSNAGDSSTSSPISVRVKNIAPMDVKIIQMTEGSISLSWKVKSNIESKYVVEVSTDSINFTSLGEFPANTTSCTIPTTFDYDQKYYFRVGGIVDTSMRYSATISNQIKASTLISASGLSSIYLTEQTPDGGYIIATIANGSNCYLIKTDKHRNVMWTKAVEYDGFRSILGVARGGDGGFYLSLYENLGNTIRDTYLSKLDADGNPVWVKFIASGYRSGVIRRLSDTTCILVIEKYSDSYSTMLKLVDVDGKVSSTITPNFNTQVYDIVPTSDSCYIYFSSANNLIKINKSGEKIWFLKVPGVQTRVSDGIKATSDGGCVFVADNVFTKVDCNGNILLQKSMDLVHLMSVLETADNGFILGGSLCGNYRCRALLMKVDAAGNTVWTRTYGATTSQCVSSIVKSQEGGYMLSGRTQFQDESTALFLIKTDENGKVNQ